MGHSQKILDRQLAALRRQVQQLERENKQLHLKLKVMRLEGYKMPKPEPVLVTPHFSKKSSYFDLESRISMQSGSMTGRLDLVGSSHHVGKSRPVRVPSGVPVIDDILNAGFELKTVADYAASDAELTQSALYAAVYGGLPLKPRQLLETPIVNMTKALDFLLAAASTKPPPKTEAELKAPRYVPSYERRSLKHAVDEMFRRSGSQKKWYRRLEESSMLRLLGPETPFSFHGFMTNAELAQARR